MKNMFAAVILVLATSSAFAQASDLWAYQELITNPEFIELTKSGKISDFACTKAESSSETQEFAFTLSIRESHDGYSNLKAIEVQGIRHTIILWRWSSWKLQFKIDHIPED